MADIKDLGGVKQRGLLDWSKYDSDAVLDTGVPVCVVVEEARRWWESVGRDEMRRHRLSARAAGKGISHDPHSANFLPSGLVQGLPWDSLSRDECVQIVKQYHHQKYRMPKRDAERGDVTTVG
jgi:hypothetical protein